MRHSRKYWLLYEFSRDSLAPSTLGGKESDTHIKKADVILVFESDVPCVPHHNKPIPETVVYHIDCDPLKEQMPMHYLYSTQSFPADGYLALTQLLAKDSVIEKVQNKDERIKYLNEQHQKRFENYKTAKNRPMSLQFDISLLVFAIVSLILLQS